MTTTNPYPVADVVVEANAVVVRVRVVDAAGREIVHLGMTHDEARKVAIDIDELLSNYDTEEAGP